MSLNEIYSDCDSVTQELKCIKEETREYCDGGNFKTPFDETTVIDGGEQYREGIFIKAEINSENVDTGGDSPTMTDENHEDICLKEKKANVPIKPDIDMCLVKNPDFHDIQTLMKTDMESYEGNKPMHNVKNEEITIDDNYLEKKGAVDGEF